MSLPLPDLLTLDEVASALRLTRATVLREAGKTLPPVYRVGRQYRFRAEDIEGLTAGAGEAARRSLVGTVERRPA